VSFRRIGWNANLIGAMPQLWTFLRLREGTVLTRERLKNEGERREDGEVGVGKERGGWENDVAILNEAM
jgi:hypothetical protein